MKVALIIVAAGSGRRMAHRQNKLFLSLQNRPIIDWTLAACLTCAQIEQVVLVIRRQDEPLYRQLVAPALQRRVQLQYGGAERSDSVAAGFAAVNQDITHILVHDGARPFVSQALLARIIARLGQVEAVVPLLPLVDTVKRVVGDRVVETPRRAELRAVQTPQGFSRALFSKMIDFAAQSDALFSDDASIAEALGATVYGVLGEDDNIKLTTPKDLHLAAALGKLWGESK